MSLTVPCHEQAGYTAHLLAATKGKTRKGATAMDFTLCENHEELFRQIDAELIPEGWAISQATRSTSLF